MTDDLFIDIDFINSVGKKINDILIQDPSNAKWVEEVNNIYNDTFEYPPDVYDRLYSILQNYKELCCDFQDIVTANEDNLEQFYNSIFNPTNQETVYYNDESSGSIHFEEEDEEKVEAYTALTPEILAQRQQQQISRVSETLFISKDLAYLLLKRFNWNIDRLNAQWIENKEHQNDILQSFHVPLSMIREPLTLKPIGKGECDVCYFEDVELYELYCGHFLCKDCWTAEINAQLDQGNQSIICRQDKCFSEVMLSDVAKFCGKEKADAYYNFQLEDQILHDKKLIHCTAPGCDQVLTLDSVGPCNVATCSCGKRICWKCQEDAHAPLQCDQIQEWRRLQDSMIKLSTEQTNWEKREFQLLKYRAKHMREIDDAYQEYMNNVQKQQKQQNDQELEVINRLKAEIKKIADPSLKEIKSVKLREKENENKIKNLERDKELKAIDDDKRNYIQMIQSPQYYQFYLRQWKENQELLAFGKYCTTDEEFIERMTKKCPKCKTPIQKDGGCNYMKCSRCRFEFCWVCGSDWSTHGDHFVCNKYDMKIKNNNDIDDSDGNLKNDVNNPALSKDKKFYMPPMKYEDRAKFSRWNHYYRRFQAHSDAKRMEGKKRNEYRKILVRSFNDMSQESANKLVDRVYQAIDLARSVLMWSYPTAYFMDMHSKAFHMFEINQGNLELSNEKLVGMVERFSGQSHDEFEKFANMNEKCADILLKEIDNFSPQ